MTANAYYDFNPSPAVWVTMLSVIVLFVLALSVMLIIGIRRSEAASVGPSTRRAAVGELPLKPARAVASTDEPSTKVS